MSALENDESVSEVIGIDLKEPAYTSAKLRYLSLDVRSPLIADYLRNYEVDTVLHLAWVFNPNHDARRTYDINVNGTKAVMSACKETAVKRLIIPGSTTAYGAHPDNPEWLREDSPIRGNRGFPYSYHKALVEGLCDEFERQITGVNLTRLRVCIVLGKYVDNFVRDSILLRGLRHAAVRGYSPHIQFLHEEDMSSAIRLALLSQAYGIYNIVPNDTLTIHQVAEIAGNPLREYPYCVLHPLVSFLWSIRQLPVPPSYLPFIQHRWTASNSLIDTELGWKPKRSTYDALISMLRPDA